MKRWESAKTAVAKRAAERAAEQLRKQGEADSVAQRRADVDAAKQQRKAQQEARDHELAAADVAGIAGIAQEKSIEETLFDQELAELKRVTWRDREREVLLGEIEKLSIAGAGLKQSKVVLFD